MAAYGNAEERSGVDVMHVHACMHACSAAAQCSRLLATRGHVLLAALVQA